MAIRYCYPMGSTADEMRKRLAESPLHKIGDAILIWVNEGDFWGLSPTPVNVDEEKRKLEREDAVLAEAEAIRARRGVG